MRKKFRRIPPNTSAAAGLAHTSVTAASKPAASARDLEFELRMSEHLLNEARAEIARLRTLAYVNPQDETPDPLTWQERAQSLLARLNAQDSGGAKTLTFEWLQDSHDCETCGLSWSEGAVVRLNGQVLVDRTPCATCFGSKSYSSDEVHLAVLSALGLEVAHQHPAS